GPREAIARRPPRGLHRSVVLPTRAASFVPIRFRRVVRRGRRGGGEGRCPFVCLLIVVGGARAAVRPVLGAFGRVRAVFLALDARAGRRSPADGAAVG